MINQKSIAVLPFYNTSDSTENQYFADGISEEIINSLSKISGLKVISRTSAFSYRNTSLDIRHIGNELGVSTVLEGSVRRSASKVRITTQLIRTDTGFQIWSEKFDRDLKDIFDLQDEISKLIAECIRENFGHFFIQDKLLTSRTNHADAYDKYLKGRHHQIKWNQSELEAAMNEYKLSIAIDPTFLMSYLGLSQCFIYLSTWNFTDRMKGMFMAFHFLSKLDGPKEYIPEYHFTKGLFHFLGKWEFSKAERHLLKAIELNPNYSDAMQIMANVQLASGRFEQAHSYIDKALLLDPNSENHHFTKASIFYFSGQYTMALSSLEQFIDINSDLNLTSRLRLLSAMMSENISEFDKALVQLDNSGQEPFKVLWRLINDKSEQTIDPKWDDHYFPLKLYLLLAGGRESEALKTLEAGINGHDGRFINCLQDPLLNSLKTNDTYQKIQAQIIPPSATISHENGKTPAPSDKMTVQEINHFQKMLETLIESEQPYLDTELTLKSLAEKIDLHPNKLSWLLNEKLHKNFSEFVNGYRLKAFQEKALDPKNGHLTLLGLAYESGFTSKSVFNDYFRKSTGLTPRVWVKQQKT